MARFRISDLATLETSPTSPATLGTRLGDLLVHSVNAAAQVEMADPQTGEYRVILQGTLDEEILKTER